jgi:hypothetical protein
MRFQTSFTPSQHLPFWNSLPFNFERIVRLETAHHSETDPFRNSKIIKRLAKH